MSAVSFAASRAKVLKRSAKNLLGDLRFRLLYQGEHLGLIHRMAAGFCQHLFCRLTMGSNDRHPYRQRFAQNQRVVIHSRAKQQRVKRVQFAHQLAFIGQKTVVHHVAALKRRKLTKGMDLDLITQRDNIAHQLLVGFPVIAQVVSHHGNFRPRGEAFYRRQLGKNRFGGDVDTVIDNLAAPCAVEAVKGLGNMLTG